MSEEESLEESIEGDGEKKGGKKKLFIIIGGAVGLLIIIGVILFFFVFSNGEEEVKEEPEEEAAEEVIEPVKIPEEEFFPGILKVQEMKLNLFQENEEIEEFIMLSFFIQFENDDDKYLLIEKMDVFQADLKNKFAGKKAWELDEVSEKILLKHEIIKDIESIIEKKSVRNIIFSEYLILDW